MKKLLISVALCAASVTLPSTVSAQPWRSIDQRQSDLYQRIEQGVRNGALTANEAAQLRRDFADLSRIEAQYRRSGGLSLTERLDLDRRFDLLSQRIRTESRDGQQRGQGPWQSIDQRQAELYRRIEQGVRNGDLTGNEAARLRNEFMDLSRIEARYRRSGGLSDFERRDLDRRFDALSRRIRSESRDDQERGDGSWRSIDQRQAELYQRIEQGVRNGGLTANEAAQLRREFSDLSQIEAGYRRSGGGLNDAERRDLDRRFDILSQRIRYERGDRNRR